MNGADVLCDVLLANDVTVCFANPGTSEMHFVAALDRKPEMRCVLGLFEGVVTGAADGYARMTDRPAATLLHTGPGLANGLANMHNARRARTPMINIVGDHASYHLPLDAPLTSDIEGLAAPMSNWVRRIAGPADVQPATEAAFRASLTPPGVTTLILPADAAWGDAEPASPGKVVLVTAAGRRHGCGARDRRGDPCRSGPRRHDRSRAGGAGRCARDRRPDLDSLRCPPVQRGSDRADAARARARRADTHSLSDRCGDGAAAGISTFWCWSAARSRSPSSPIRENRGGSCATTARC